MSDIAPNWLDDPEDPAEQANNPLREAREAARRQHARAKELEEAATAAAALERELAFTKAGVDTDSLAGAIFARGYDGELTKEAIQAAAASFNLGAPAATATPAPEPTVDTPLQEGEAALLGAPQQLSGTPPTTEPPAEDPYLAAQKVHDGMIDDGLAADVAIGQAFNSLVNAANAGDRRVIIDSRSAQALGG